MSILDGGGGLVDYRVNRSGVSAGFVEVGCTE